MPPESGDPAATRDDEGWVTVLLEHAQNGALLDLAADGEPPDPAGVDSWPEAQRVPADALRRTLLQLQRHPELADPRGLRIVGADFHDRLDLADLNVPCQLWLDDCRLRAGIDLTAARFSMLSLERSHVTAAQGDPAMTALGATITGHLVLAGATLTNDGRTALALDRASIGSAVLSQLTAAGEVRALDATIGQLSLVGATLTNQGGIALALDRASIGGAVLSQLTAAGQIRAAAATIGQLSLVGATLTGQSGVALALDQASIGSAVLDQLTATGEVRAVGATVTGQLRLCGATLTADDSGRALTLQGAGVGALWLRGLEAVSGAVDLSGCEIDTLVVGQKSELPPLGFLVAAGWRLGLVQGQLANDARLAQAWLDTRPADQPYTPQPARALADLYERSGHPDQARRLRYTAARQVARNAPRWARPWHVIYGVVVGHGYYPLRTIGWLAAAFLIAGILSTSQAHKFIPTDPGKASIAAADATATPADQLAPFTGATACPDLGTYPCFTPWSYALHTVVPPASAVSTPAWQPIGWMLAAITTLKTAGWMLVVLLLAGVTGLLHRT